jgi:hypothetical protein
MKLFFGILAGFLLFSSCDNELVVTDEWKDIPVVWGLLNASDTAHYIRVEKAFLDPTTSALDIARIPDSLYYDNATVSLKRLTSGQVFQLERVNGDLEGYPREGGIFAETPNYLFKIKANVINLVPNETYEFILDRGDGKPLVTAQTIVLPKPVLRIPSAGALLGFKRNSLFTFQWNEMPNAGIFDVKLDFHYSEKSDETGNVFVPKSFEWTVAKGISDREIKIDGTDFYTTVRDNIEADLNAIRQFDSININVWAGGKELAEFIRITQANTGITSTQDIPEYTNLSEGIGIFSSRNVSRNTGFELALPALDSLRNSSITKALNFQ